MANQVKHHKAYRCRIDHTGRIFQLKENCKISMPMSYTLEKSITYILNEYPKENIIIKSDKGGSGNLMVMQGEKNKPHVRGIGCLPEKNTTKWLYLMKNDGTIWTITDNHYVGKQIR